MHTDRDGQYLRMAARLALRGHGGAEPNPMVGCVIVSSCSPEQVVGWGYHRRCGGWHAEIEAIRRAGASAKGATLYCTLEPCNHTGRTGPCTQAIIQAGIARVVIAQRDPNPIASGGIAALEAAGINVELHDACPEAVAVSQPFVHRVRTGLPWVIAKWAQTIDGRVATRPPLCESQWISSAASRRMVHRERGRVDAILTGIGTVLRDDPQLTARGVRIRRPRPAMRVVIDPELRTPLNAKLIATTKEVRTFIACGEAALAAGADRAAQLRDRGALVCGFAMRGDELPLDAVLRELAARHEVATVLTECGPGLLSRLFQRNLVNEAWVFIAPLLLGDAQAKSAVEGMTSPRLSDGVRMTLTSLRRRGGDIIAHYRVESPLHSRVPDNPIQ